MNPPTTKEQFADKIGQQLNVLCIQSLVSKCAEQMVEIEQLRADLAKLTEEKKA